MTYKISFCHNIFKGLQIDKENKHRHVLWRHNIFNASLTSNKICTSSHFKTISDNKIIVTQKLKFVLRSVENIVGKGENAGNQHFLVFRQ